MEDPLEILRLADDGCPHHVEPTAELLDELAAMGEFGGISAPVERRFRATFVEDNREIVFPSARGGGKRPALEVR